MWASRRQQKKEKKRLLERIPHVCCYVRGVNKHLPPALAAMPRAWSNSPDCRGSPTVCARSEPKIWSYGRLQREGARPDRCVCALTWKHWCFLTAAQKDGKHQAAECFPDCCLSRPVWRADDEFSSVSPRKYSVYPWWILYHRRRFKCCR